MRLIIGLGNPGKQYEATRHNVGFYFLDQLRKSWDLPAFEYNKKFDAEISKGTAGGKEFLLAKPQTFMNLSGTSVRNIMEFYKLSADDIMIIHDDLDIALGKYKLATDSSSAGHNGVQHIIDMLGTQKFRRIRIGIGKAPEQDPENPACKLGAHDFVLGKFAEDESRMIEDIFGEIEKEIISKL